MIKKTTVTVFFLIVSVAIILTSAYVPFGIYNLKDTPIFVISIAVSLPMLAYGILDYGERKRVYDAERSIPDLLRDLSNFTSFGVPLSQAFQKIGENSYGVLTEGTRRVSSLISAGVSFEEAIQNLGYGIKSQKISMVSKILQKSNESGSNTSDVIWILSDFTSRSELLRQSRLGEMKNYDLVMIISFAVFLFVILFLDIRFLNVMLSHTSGTRYFISSQASAVGIRDAFSAGVIIQAVAIGIISGILRDVRLSSGVLLSGILVIVSTAIFALMGVF